MMTQQSFPHSITATKVEIVGSPPQLQKSN
jgi:hypothetical protein